MYWITQYKILVESATHSSNIESENATFKEIVQKEFRLLTSPLTNNGIKNPEKSFESRLLKVAPGAHHGNKVNGFYAAQLAYITSYFNGRGKGIGNKNKCLKKMSSFSCSLIFH